MPTRRSSTGDSEQRAIGRRLKGLRIAQGLSVEKVAEALSMSPKNWSHYETGRNRLAARDLSRIAAALQVEPSLLIERLQLDVSTESAAPAPSTHAMTELYEFFRTNPDLTDAATDLALFTNGQQLSDEGVRAIIYTYKTAFVMPSDE